MLKQRVLTSVVGLPILIAFIWFGSPWFTIFIAACALLGAREFYRMACAAKFSPLTIFGYIWTLLFVIAPHFNYPFITQALITSAVMIPLIAILFRKQREGACAGWAWTIAGILYIGWLLSHLVAMRYLDNGRNWVFLILFADFACDTTAFFIGRAMGKHRMAPNISPKKTWEGSIAGFLAAIVASVILYYVLNLTIGYGHAIFIGVLIGIFGQLGDLAESLLKRNTGVKDASKLLPGHGGMLDRIDSIAFVSAVIYYYVVWCIQ